MVNFILSDNCKARDMRKNYIIYVVPMLNPDGVIHGNHRTDLCGFDMNRRWTQPSPWIHPTIYAVKNLSYLIKEERNIDVFCDIHGHF
jgi:murein tripeptide amidase MpaA